MRDPALLIKRAAMKLGIDIREYSPARSEAARLSLLLRHYKVDLVLDVGANAGQFSNYLRSIGYGGSIVCFEPLPLLHETLTRRFAGDPGVVIAPRTALGNGSGEVALHISGNSESSSILPVLDCHVAAEPDAAPVGEIMVPLARLDDVAPPYMDGFQNVFLKIDAQGYESEVLQGAATLLPRIRGIQLELSLLPQYEGEMPFRPMIDLMERLGFMLHDINPCFSDRRTGRTYQVDAIYFRE